MTDKEIGEAENHLKGCDNVNWLGEWAAEYGRKLIDEIKCLNKMVDVACEKGLRKEWKSTKYRGSEVDYNRLEYVPITREWLEASDR